MSKNIKAVPTSEYTVSSLPPIDTLKVCVWAVQKALLKLLLQSRNDRKFLSS